MAGVNCTHWRDINCPGGGACALAIKERPSFGYCNLQCKSRKPHETRDIILRNHQGAGDQAIFTGLVRDLQLSNPGRFRVAVDVWGKELFENNPYVTPIEQLGPKPLELKIEGFIPGDDELPYVMHWQRMLEQRLNVTIRRTKTAGDIHLSDAEKAAPPMIEGDYWLGWFGGHHGVTAKWWDPREAQKVVDHFHGRITFVQVGRPEHWHVKLDRVVDLCGKTSMRDMVKLMYHTQGGVGPISFGMHLAAAVPTKPGAPCRRAYVVIAGGRESVPLNAYPSQTILSNIGSLRCCLGGACWRNNSHSIGGRRVDCEQPIDVWPEHQVQPNGPKGLRLARCMTMITAKDVIAAIGRYVAGIAEARAHEQKVRDVGAAVAAENLPKCLKCPAFIAQKSGTSIYCREAPACCGETTGVVDLVNGQCAINPPLWRASEAEAWRNHA